jgi:hypothetical protein
MNWFSRKNNDCAMEGKLADVLEALRFRLAQVLPERLVFDQKHARPEEVNVAAGAGDLPDRLLKSGDLTILTKRPKSPPPGRSGFLP